MSYSYDDDDDSLDIKSGEDNDLSDNDDARDSDENEFAMGDDLIRNQSHEVSYVVLKEEDIRKRQKDDIAHVSTLLCITQVESIALLLHYHWSVSKTEDEWFTDEERVRKLVGIFKKPLVESYGVEIECGICFESYGRNEIESVSCGHPYCVTCWTGYIASKIKDGFGCLTVKCPEPSCSAAVGQDLILKFTMEQQDKDKYYRFLLRSYVEEIGSEKRIKWCPSPGCDYAVELSSGSDQNYYDVSCLCSNSFCWNCSEEAHRPVDCETVSKWIFKNNDESENTNWILANTKPCPKCKRQIEKNQGCNHMRCSEPCGHHFCWICLKSTSEHYACNDYKPDEGDETENRRQRAKNAIDRYTHYYERWANNEASRKRATRDLEVLQSVQLKDLSLRQSTTETQLEFTVEAWLQIIECRRVLKWTYAYGYYLPENERAKREFFEYLQAEAERALEKLHYCAEKELKLFLSDVPATTSFNDFRTKLIGLTQVNKTYFENLVKAWESGLEEEGLYESNSTNSSFKSQKMSNGSSSKS